MVIPYQQQHDLLSGWRDQDDRDIIISKKESEELIKLLSAKSEKYRKEANENKPGIYSMRFVTVTTNNGKTYVLKQTFSKQTPIS